MKHLTSFEITAIARDLETSGIGHQQAEKIAEVIVNALKKHSEATEKRAAAIEQNAASKIDLGKAKMELTYEIAKTKTELQTEIVTAVANSKSEMLKWVHIILLLIQAAFIIFAVVFIH